MDLPDELVTHINEVSKKYTKHIMERLNAKELTVVVNYGNAQKIKHYHMHLLPNFGTRAERNLEDVYKELL